VPPELNPEQNQSGINYQINSRLTNYSTISLNLKFYIKIGQ